MDTNQIVLITGGTGLIGSELSKLLKDKGHTVRILSRTPNGTDQFYWDPMKGELDVNALYDVGVIFHLAGAGIADKKWTIDRKQLIIDSRVKGPQLLLEHKNILNKSLKAFISSSGVSYYGVKTTDHIFTEDDPEGVGFPPHCVELWEDAADQFSEMCRVVKMRTGIVLSRKSGALSRLEKPINYGLGAWLGNGKQWIPWVHNYDVARAYYFAMDRQISGVYNLVADEHLTNKQLTKKVAKALGKTIWLPPVPGFLLRLVYGKMASLVLQGSRSSNAKLVTTGFTFQYPDFDSALKDLYKD